MADRCTAPLMITDYTTNKKMISFVAHSLINYQKLAHFCCVTTKITSLIAMQTCCRYFRLRLPFAIAIVFLSDCFVCASFLFFLSSTNCFSRIRNTYGENRRMESIPPKIPIPLSVERISRTIFFVVLFGLSSSTVSTYSILSFIGNSIDAIRRLT